MSSRPASGAGRSAVENFDEFMSRLLAENPNVRRFSTSVVLSTHKRQLLVPL